MKRKVLIPVDFSEYSNQAIEYACKLNANVKHDIDLIHIFTDHSNIYLNSLEDPELIDPRIAFAKRDADSLILKYQAEFPDIKFNIIFKDGNLFDELRKTVTDEIYDAIIMGTKGASGLDSLLLGSNMYEVFQNTKVPVLAIPSPSKSLNTQKIGLLCNFKDAEIDVLKQAINVFGNGFQLFLVHINSENNTMHELDKKFNVFIEKIVEETEIDDISYVIKAQTFFVKYKEDISSAINSVISDEQLDILLITKSKKSFLRKIIEENVVKQMAYDIHIPKFFGKTY